jgi:hypothetical protein
VALFALAFVAISVWWVMVDKHVPDGDQTRHLSLSFYYYEHLLKGHELFSFRYEVPNGALYPPFVFQVGMLAALVTGKSVDSLVIGQNLVFVPLLAVAIYRVGSIAFNRLTGALAVAFALASPMVISQFHMFMLDMPLMAMVAAGVWLLLETDRFERRGACIVAGVVLGLGLLTKQSYPFFMLPFVAVLIARGGWRRPAGVALVGGIALAIAAPWYIQHLDRLSDVAKEATAQVDNPWGSEAPRWSLENYSWYGWNLVNLQLLLPLTIFFLLGAVAAAVRWLRARASSDYTPELLTGAVGAILMPAVWFGYHDPRYTIPGMAFMAVLGSAWISWQRRLVGYATAALLLVVLAVNTTSVNLGVLGPVEVAVPGGKPSSVAKEHRLTVLSDFGYVVGQPREAGDILELMRAAKRDGISEVAFQPHAPRWLDPAGMSLFAILLELPAVDPGELGRSGIYFAAYARERGLPAPCAKLPDGTGLYIFRGDPGARDPRTAKNLYCPRRRDA